MCRYAQLHRRTIAALNTCSGSIHAVVTARAFVDQAKLGDVGLEARDVESSLEDVGGSLGAWLHWSKPLCAPRSPARRRSVACANGGAAVHQRIGRTAKRRGAVAPPAGQCHQRWSFQQRRGAEHIAVFSFGLRPAARCCRSSASVPCTSASLVPGLCRRSPMMPVRRMYSAPIPSCRGYARRTIMISTACAMSSRGEQIAR